MLCARGEHVNMLTDLLERFAMLTVIYQSLTSVQHNLPQNTGFVEHARKYGYKATEHDVITEDGYILKMFHIPGDRNKTVLLSHGIMDSSETFLVRGPTSLVATLVDNGYDVWLLNNRGNPHSRRHVRLDPDKHKSFWNFSFHELAVYDLPACIDFVLSQNKVNRISLIGHSLGNMQYYILGAMRPEYNDKVSIAIALAPVGVLNVDNLEEPVSSLVGASQMINEWLISSNLDEVFGGTSFLLNFTKIVCAQKWLGYELCVKGVASIISGKDLAELEPEVLLELLKHYPCSTSRKIFLHLSQVSLSKRLAQFDYGTERNLQMHQTPSPPVYDLSKATMKIALLVGANDKIANVKNCEILRDKLPNVVSYQVLEYSNFNHMDYVWGRHMYKYLFPHILKLLDKYGASGKM